ncbi:MAG: hypothetical protein U0Y82_13230 [Thermoleophilia bacterium]
MRTRTRLVGLATVAAAGLAIGGAGAASAATSAHHVKKHRHRHRVTSTTTGTNSTTTDPTARGDRHGRVTVETVTDTSVAAGAIGISETDLLTALKSGKTLAEVATANSVDPQKVIDALVADQKAELAAAVTAGTITQAQADQMATGITQRVTDQVNGTGGGGSGAGCDHTAPAA